MSFVLCQAAHCDQCFHEWLVVAASIPTHCAKCKSRRWNASQKIAGGRIDETPATKAATVGTEVKSPSEAKESHASSKSPILR